MYMLRKKPAYSRIFVTRESFFVRQKVAKKSFSWQGELELVFNYHSFRFKRITISHEVPHVHRPSTILLRRIKEIVQACCWTST